MDKWLDLFWFPRQQHIQVPLFTLWAGLPSWALALAVPLAFAFTTADMAWAKLSRTQIGRFFVFVLFFFCRQSIGLFEILCIETCGGYWRLPRRLTSWIRPATAIFIKWKSKGCGGYWRLTRRLPLNSVLLLWFYRKVVVYTRLNILLLKECMHHLGVKILEFSPGGAGEIFTNQRQQTFMMQNATQKNF